MESIQAVKTAFAGAQGWYQGTVADVSAEQANAVPPGVTHPIGELMAHILHSIDGLVNMFCRGQQSLWEREGWGAKLGVPMMLGQETESARAFRVDPVQLTDYGNAVFAELQAYLDTLAPSDLDREIDMTAAGLGKMPLGAFLLNPLLGNTFAHTGEISALKGLHGAKGYPF